MTPRFCLVSPEEVSIPAFLQIVLTKMHECLKTYEALIVSMKHAHQLVQKSWMLNISIIPKKYAKF